MKFKSLGQCIEFLEKEKELVRITHEVDPDLEMAEIHRQVFQADGPAVFFEKVKNSPFSAVSNLFGTYERALKIFEPELENIKTLVNLRSVPFSMLKSPIRGIKALSCLIHALPLKRKKGPVLECRTSINKLPMIRCWPKDGGGFILLPQVFSRDPEAMGIMKSNLGMYRIQLSGGDYLPDRETGLHYQLHRGIGNHHFKALKKGIPLRVSIFVGGPPAHTLAAVMPLPEGMPEICFAGALSSRAFRYGIRSDSIVSLDADFCITGRVLPYRTKKEGPFGDHLGYYSLEHEFPYLEVESVFHRKNAVWPFTVVGRPPQEDSVFGRLVHEIAGNAVSAEIPGVTAVHAVDAAGVHPLLLAKARERYSPYEETKPMELLTHANAILGFGQLSLAKYLFICAHEDAPDLDIKNEMEFFIHFLERVDFKEDLHFQTSTTMDTLDYSSEELNRGSKLVITAAGKKKRELLGEIPVDLLIPFPFSDPAVACPGVLVIQAPPFISYQDAAKDIKGLDPAFCHRKSMMQGFPLMVLADDSKDAVLNFSNFLWTAFSKSNPSHDVYGVDSFIKFKHFGCKGSLIIDARKKPFHAPTLEVDQKIAEKVKKLGLKGGALYGII